MSNGTGELRGKVVDKITKMPLGYATISIKGNELRAICDDKGEYVIYQVAGGTYTIEASMKGYVSSKVESVSISPNTVTAIDFSLLPVRYFDLKEHVPYFMKISLLSVLIVIIIACLTIPMREPTIRERKVEAAIKTIELPPQLKQLEEPPPPPRPEMPVAAESEEEVEASTIDPTAGVDFEKAPPAPEAPDVYDFRAVEEPPQLLQKYYVPPEYPEIARKAGIEGSVTLELIVDTNGCVIDIKVAESLHELLDEEAVKVARKWRFKPARQRDKTVKVRVLQPVRFHLEE